MGLQAGKVLCLCGWTAGMGGMAAATGGGGKQCWHRTPAVLRFYIQLPATSHHVNSQVCTACGSVEGQAAVGDGDAGAVAPATHAVKTKAANALRSCCAWPQLASTRLVLIPHRWRSALEAASVFSLAAASDTASALIGALKDTCQRRAGGR